MSINHLKQTSGLACFATCVDMYRASIVLCTYSTVRTCALCPCRLVDDLLLRVIPAVTEKPQRNGPAAEAQHVAAIRRSMSLLQNMVRTGHKFLFYLRHTRAEGAKGKCAIVNVERVSQLAFRAGKL